MSNIEYATLLVKRKQIYVVWNRIDDYDLALSKHPILVVGNEIYF